MRSRAALPPMQYTRDTDSFASSGERSAGAVCISQEQEIAEQLDVCRLSCPTQLSHERHCAFVEQ